MAPESEQKGEAAKRPLCKSDPIDSPPVDVDEPSQACRVSDMGAHVSGEPANWPREAGHIA